MRLLILLLIAYLAYQTAKRWIYRNFQSPRMTSSESKRELDDLMVQDPVCGVYFPKREGVSLHADGRDPLFCSMECRDRFLSDHEKANR